MYTFKAKEIKLKSKEEIPWTLDGEFGGQHEEVHIINKKQALEIMVEREEEE
jgi:diacylglycerol kinase family enzyme